MARQPLVEWTQKGLYCRQGEVFIDPSRKVKRAIVTHGHSDHARRGSAQYLAVKEGEDVLRLRLGKKATIQGLAYGEVVVLNGVRISLHPAGHIRGSSQVRLERDGEVWVVSGDYKLKSDTTCAGFALQRCHTFVTESTFGLPIYRWPEPTQVFEAINSWWKDNRDAGRNSMLLGYALGKTQRLLKNLDCSIGPIYVHETIHEMNEVYRASGVELPTTQILGERPSPGSMILSPPTVLKTNLMANFEPVATAIASGWAQVERIRKSRSAERGFVLSDHVDWPGIIHTVEATGADRVLVHHGMAENVARYLRSRGADALALTKENMSEV